MTGGKDADNEREGGASPCSNINKSPVITHQTSKLTPNISALIDKSNRNVGPLLKRDRQNSAFRKYDSKVGNDQEKDQKRQTFGDPSFGAVSKNESHHNHQRKSSDQMASSY